MKAKATVLLKKFLKHELITGSLFIFIGGLISNVFSFLYNLFIARNLGYADYATMASLMSIIALATLPSQSFANIIVQFATNFFTKNQEKYAAAFYIKITKLIIVISVGIILLSIIFAGPLSIFLKINSPWYIFIVGVLVSISYLSVVNASFLQSLLKFKLLSVFTVLGGLVRLVLGLALIMLGWKVYGALGALLGSFIFGFFLNLIPLKFIFSIPQKEVSVPIKELFFYALPASIAIISLSSFTSTDIILVKHFFSPQQAGLYSGISLIGKVIFYFTAPIPAVMFPLIIKRYNKGENIHGLFYLSLGLVFFASVAISCFYFLFPSFTITFFLGGKGYLQTTPYLGFFAIYLSLFSVVNVFTTFFLSLKKTKVAYIIGAGAVLQIFLINLFHKDFFEIIKISIILSLLLLVGLLLYYLKEYGPKKEKTKKVNISYHSSL